MARSWQYSRYRRVIMQGVMWIVLGATVTLAGLQVRQHSAAPRISLQMTGYDFGPWRVPVPSTWSVTKRDANALIFQEPDEAGGRELAVEQDVVDRLTTSAHFLAEKIHLIVLGKVLSVEMGGQQGIMVIEPMGGNGGGAIIDVATVLANGDAITIRLRVFRNLLPDDVSLAQTIASAIMYQPNNHQTRQDPDSMPDQDKPHPPDDED